MAEGSDLPVWAVLDALRDGKSATAGLAAYRAAGGEVRTQTWYRLHGEVQSALAGKISEASAPLGRRPTGDELTTWTTRNAAGYLQQVEVLVRDRATGEVMAKPFSVTGPDLVSRGAAISEALDAYMGNADIYEEQVLGAVHVGAYELTPDLDG
jgi:hypothetical protein